MPNFLKNLKVSKVSFVDKPANKRKFILLKSADAEPISGDAEPIINNNNSDNNKNNQGDQFRMRPELKNKLKEVMKSEKSPDKIIGVLKADTELKVTDVEITEVQDMLELSAIPTTTATPPVEKNTDREQALLDRIETLEKAQKRSTILSWLTKECPFLADDSERVADEILQLEKVSPVLAENHKKSLQKASIAVMNSQLFNENGIATTEVLLEREADGFELIQKVNRDMETLRKSEKPMSVQNIVNVIKRHASDYNDYRIAHILRAKTQAI